MNRAVHITERPHSVNDVIEMQRVLIPSVDMLEDKIRAVPVGAYRELGEIRSELAADHGTDITCPVTVQRHLKVIAVIAHSAVTLKDPDAVPFWRVVDTDKPGADRLAGGKGFIKAQRAREQAGK